MLVFMLLIVGISFVSAQDSLGVFKQDSTVQLLQTCSICDYVTLDSIKLPNSTTLFINENMTQSGSTFYYDFNQTDLLGEYIYNTHFGNYTAPVSFEVTSSGRVVSDSKVYANILLFLFFILLIFTFHYSTKNINYEKWYNSIIARYEHKNYVRVILSSLGYNVMKNKFIWYYLFGLPILLIVTDIAYTFGVDSMIYLLQVILSIYYYGFLLVGVFFFGYLQEWVVNLVDEIKSMDFGV